MSALSVLTRLALAATGLVLWWSLSWGAHELLQTAAAAVFAAIDRLVQDPLLNARVEAVFDLLYEVAQATTAVFWILGTLALVVGGAWAIRTGRRLPRLGWR